MMCAPWPLRSITDNSDEIGELMRKIQKHNFDAHGHHYRGTHVRPHLLRVGADIRSKLLHLSKER